MCGSRKLSLVALMFLQFLQFFFLFPDTKQVPTNHSVVRGGSRQNERGIC
jgi:hypothetical protein